MPDRRGIDESFRVARRRVGGCTLRSSSTVRSPRHGRRDSIVRFTPWTCATCGIRDDLVIAGAIAFCADCLEASVRWDADDVYQDTGGGD
jgi:hypothetical protein